MNYSSCTQIADALDVAGLVGIGKADHSLWGHSSDHSWINSTMVTSYLLAGHHSPHLRTPCGTCEGVRIPPACSICLHSAMNTMKLIKTRHRVSQQAIHYTNIPSKPRHRLPEHQSCLLASNTQIDPSAANAPPSSPPFRYPVIIQRHRS